MAEGTEIEKLMERQIMMQEKILGILENHTERIKNLEEFAWKGISERKKK